MNSLNKHKVLYVASAKRSKTKIGSKFIKWGTRHLEPKLKPCAHLAIILRGTLVIESTISTGVQIMPYDFWIKENEIVYVFEKEYKGRLSEYIPSIMQQLWGKKYDWLGILYFSWKIAKNKYLGTKLPIINKWDDPNKRFCVEIFGEKLAMTSPIQMVAKWSKDPTLTRIPELEHKYGKLVS